MDLWKTVRLIVVGGAVALVGAPVVMLACGVDPTNYVNAFDLPPGGKFVNPDVVTCQGVDGGGDCPVNPGVCCVGPAEPGGGQCLDAGLTCPSETGSVTCNETADCQIHNSCCASVPQDGGYFTAQCATSCPSPQVQLCRTNGECPSDKCVVQQCSDGLVYEMCELYSLPPFACKALGVFPDGGLDVPSDD